MLNERLKLAKDLLSDKGVIFISIDDSEQAYLKVLCDEIFGERNFACFSRIAKNSSKSTDSVAKNHNHMLCYRNGEIVFSMGIAKSKNYPCGDEFFNERGGYKLSQTLDYNSLQYNPSMDYEAEVFGQKFYPGGEHSRIERQNGKYKKIDCVWRWGKEKLKFGVKNGFVAIKGGRIYTKPYFNATISKDKGGSYFVEQRARENKLKSIDFMEHGAG